MRNGEAPSVTGEDAGATSPKRGGNKNREAPLASKVKFCPECGKEIATEAKCASCGNKLERGQKFCGSCGAKV